ncbi:hypothetical protein QZH41_006798 [Actinostola sp. cb2023]|nr:hypothetical protein QZH41_006798 [Actinostola sp. cb2023]
MADYTVRNTVTVVPLDGSNYGTWKIQCRMALIKENLWSIVSGTEVAPAETEVEKFTKFVVRRNRALATIVLSVNTSLLYLLGDPEDPVVVWKKKLSEQFQKKTWANKLSLRRRLNKLRLQEGDSVKGHIKSITEIFNELAVIGAPMDEEDKVVTLLASLPDKFDMLVTALEANSEVPNMEVVTERLFHEENKLKERETVEKPYEKVMLGTKSKDRPKCHHCGKPGHLKRNCWSLKKEKEKEQQNKPESKPVKHKANVVAADSDSESLGLVTQALAASVCANDVWIIDSGATCHMTNDRSSLRDILELTEPVHVQLGDGKVLNATARGTVTLYTVLRGGNEKRCNLKDVLFVPKLSYSLLSVPKATGAGLKVSFDKSESYAHIPKDERNKLDPKARKCVFLGYGTDTKAYRLFDVERQRVIYSRDVKFDEGAFGILQKDKPDGTVIKFVDVELSNNDDVELSNNDDVDEGPSVLRQSSREGRPPDRLGEWVTVVSDGIVEPTTVSEALNGPDADQWHVAMQQEMDSLHKHDVWNITELPDGRKAVGSKWVFRVKYNADGSMERRKARLVAQGFSQKQGVDYDETFSPVVRFESLRTVIALSVKQELKLHQMDVTTAFLNGDLKEEVYMRQPEGFSVKGKEHLVCKLNKSLYGLKQSPRCWNYTLDEHLKSMGFVQTPSDPCIYVSDEDANPFIIAVYVDDIVLAGPSDEKIAEVKQNISERFEVKDMGELKYFLGVQVIQEDGKVWIGQPTYTENILKKFGMENCKPVSTPVDPNFKLTKAGADNVPHNQSDYQSVVGSLLYLSSVSRPDIAFAVSNVARYSSNPTNEHWAAVKRILRYLKDSHACV